MTVPLGKVTDFNKDECLDSMSRIINGCDGNDDNNPLDWKFGGKWQRGEYTYEVAPIRDKRPWPPIKATSGTCGGWYKVFFGAYDVEVAWWATWDNGQDTLLKSLRGCMGPYQVDIRLL